MASHQSGINGQQTQDLDPLLSTAGEPFMLSLPDHAPLYLLFLAVGVCCDTRKLCLQALRASIAEGRCAAGGSRQFLR